MLAELLVCGTILGVNKICSPKKEKVPTLEELRQLGKTKKVWYDPEKYKNK